MQRISIHCKVLTPLTRVAYRDCEDKIILSAEPKPTVDIQNGSWHLNYGHAQTMQHKQSRAQLSAGIPKQCSHYSTASHPYFGTPTEPGTGPH